MILPHLTDRPLGGRFAVEREVGRGGVGVVYQAFDLETQQRIALKVVAGEAGNAPDDEARLKREGEVLRALQHPAIVRVVATGVLPESGQPFVAMEWIDGEELSARQLHAPLTIPQIALLGILLARGLHAAHTAGVVHRDIKPSNILLRPRAQPADDEFAELDVEPILVDFGVAADRELRSLRAGDIVGTPAYMAPEQARGDAKVDARADLYALGATLFELVAGRPPHVGPNPLATLARLVTTDAPRLSQLCRGVPPLLDDLVHSLLMTDPAARPESARETEARLLEALTDCQRLTWQPEDTSARATSASRLVTTLVALHFGSPVSRQRALEVLVERSADVAPLGQDALVAHLGARRAVGNEAASALDLARRLARSGAQVGIATGRARVDLDPEREDVQPLGEVVDRAAALARESARGTVLVDATTSELGRGRYELRVRDDGSALVGDVIQGAHFERSGGAPFLGREPELAQLMSTFARVRTEDTPVLVTVTGPPGIGKTRLRREALARISASPNPPRVVVQRSEAYGRAHALGAAADLLRSIVRLPKRATLKEAEGALVSHLGSGLRAEAGAPMRQLLARLLVNDTMEVRRGEGGLRDALWIGMTDLVLEVLRRETVVIVMEDLQWADPESLGWLDHLLGRAAHRPLLLLACVRPAFWVEHGARFGGRDHLRVDLRPISVRASRGIVAAVLGPDAATDVVERLAEQAGGSPLFAEELARLAASGRDPRHAPTIEAAIQVSLDALDDCSRVAVSRISVFGLTCWDCALEALGIARPESVLRALAAAELLVQQNTSRFPGTSEWSFKHALVRDVAYRALGEAQRRELHAQTAGWLASMGEDSATVAGHYDLGEQHDLAAVYWERAAQRALTANALGDALVMAERSLTFARDPETGFRRASCLDEAWSRLDPRASDRETAVLALEEHVFSDASRVRARGSRARYDDARGAGVDISDRLAEARDAAAVLGLHDEVARCAAALAARAAFAGDFELADAETARLLELSRAYDLKSAAVDAYQTQAIVRQTRGALSAALESRRNAAGAARAGGLKEREAMLMTNLGFALTTIGARQEARTAIESGLTLAEAIGSSGGVRHAQMNLLGWAAVFGNDRRLEVHLSEVRADADAAASGIWAAPDRANLGMLFYRGVELLRQKESRASVRALALLRMAANSYREAGHNDVLPVALGMWAEAERQCRNVDNAVRIASEAVGLLAGGAPSLLNESSVYVTLHDALVDAGAFADARGAIERGIAPLTRRLEGLTGTAYARHFLTELPANAALIAAAERYGSLPDSIHAQLAREQH